LVLYFYEKTKVEFMLKLRSHYYYALLSIALLGCFQNTNAQVVKVDTLTHWKKAFKAGLNLNQASFSSNWKAGGINSIGFNAYLNYKANYKNGANSWDNEIDLLYGMVNNAGQGTRKTLDRIFLDTRYGRSITSKWDFSFSANLQSQFAEGFSYAKDAAGVEHLGSFAGLGLRLGRHRAPIPRRVHAAESRGLHVDKQPEFATGGDKFVKIGLIERLAAGN
jgi:hypothetical protein